ncbi:MAG: 2'-5' RNA ligase family protein [Rhodobacteraceae bacterium]|nr:2'-5' RNA ligase family protein [Paracoccaceae bacterium]
MAKAWQAFGTGETFRHETLHLSIYAVAGADDLDPVLVKRARQAACVLRTAPFTLCFDWLMAFNGRPANYPLVLATDRTSDRLNEVAAELHTACRAMGITGRRSAKVTPHVTLAYGPGFSKPRKLDEPILWKVDEVVLIDSLQGRGRHVPLGLWPLPQDRQQPGFDFRAPSAKLL